MDQACDLTVFDEAGYARANADVADAIREGRVRSGYEHYVQHGFRDGRPMGGQPREPRNLLLPHHIPGLVAPQAMPGMAFSVEELFVSRHGMLLAGWADDTRSTIHSIRIVSPDWRIVLDGLSLVRIRRTDVEENRGDGVTHNYGFFGIVATENVAPCCGPAVIEVWLADGSVRAVTHKQVGVEDHVLRDLALTRLSAAAFLGNKIVQATMALDRGAGAALCAVNRAVTRSLVQAPFVQKFGTRRTALAASVIVCLFGKPDYLFLQACLYAALPGFETYEVVAVCNSPELAEVLMSMAATASLAYGLDLTLVVLPGNAGFGGACNAAARLAGSRRLIFVNPDVFPKDPLWAAKHRDLVAGAPACQTRLFGVPLYYDDGALMHGGMHFDIDSAIGFEEGRARAWRLLRVEHDGKGAPASEARFLTSRQVPAVTGAFISCDRAWFEQLGGFTEDYVFGHYEDADICLKSWEQGMPPWLHDIRMWHLEGKGGGRAPIHDAGALVNRWRFSQIWMPMIEDGLCGASPARLQGRTQPDTPGWGVARSSKRRGAS